MSAKQHLQRAAINTIRPEPNVIKILIRSTDIRKQLTRKTINIQHSMQIVRQRDAR